MIAPDFQLVKAHVEHGVGVGHFLAADGAVACEMCCRRNELVDHGVGTTTAIISLRHLLARLVAQPVGGPRLAFRDVVAHGVLQGVESPTVGLGTGLHTELVAPVKVGVGEALLHQLGLEVLKIVAGALDLFLKVFCHGDYRIVVECATHRADFEK